MLKFLVFADTHYKKGQYRTQVQDLKGILKKLTMNNWILWYTQAIFQSIIRAHLSF